MTGLLVAIVVMLNQANRYIDRTQAETNARFNAAQVENSRQHDDLNRRFDELFKVLRAFEGRISRLEERLETPADGGSARDRGAASSARQIAPSVRKPPGVERVRSGRPARPG